MTFICGVFLIFPSGVKVPPEAGGDSSQSRLKVGRHAGWAWCSGWLLGVALQVLLCWALMEGRGQTMEVLLSQVLRTEKADPTLAWDYKSSQETFPTVSPTKTVWGQTVNTPNMNPL